MTSSKPPTVNPDLDLEILLKACREKRVKSIDVTGLGRAMGVALAIGVLHELESQGMSARDPDAPRAPIHCDAEYHFSRMRGGGVHLAFRLYTASMRLSHASRMFRVSLKDLQPYFDVTSTHQMYDAAALLIHTGWWEVVEAHRGQPSVYHPVSHTDWVAKWKKSWSGSPCIQKQDSFPFQDEDELSKFNKQLWAHLGCGKQKPFKSYAKRLLKTASADEILAAAKGFMNADRGEGEKGRYSRFMKHFLQVMQSCEPQR